MKLIPSYRVSDNYGQGHYGASRGSRTHKGQDFKAFAGSTCLSDVCGKVTKFGYPYRKHLEYRYVQVTTDEGYDVRYFYIQPLSNLNLGDNIKTDDEIGIVQDLELIYPNGMDNHIHFEVKKGGLHIDPLEFLKQLKEGA